MGTEIWLLLFVIGALVAAYQRASLRVWTIAFAVVLALFSALSHASIFTQILVWIVFAAIAIPLNITALRQHLFSQNLLTYFRRVMPKMSRTEREALEAGTVSWDGELFSGAPDWEKLHAIPAPALSAEEQAFIDGPVEELCRMLDDWTIGHVDYDLPPAVWQFLKDNGFWSLIIPKRYGGLEFSAQAHAAMLVKLSSRSSTAFSTAAVPNSLGPAELLLQYGTDAQKDYYLPRLAKGDEIPCFALTGPNAGSDASSLTDHGIVCRGEFEGKEVLGMRVTWDKRYITLAPVATVLGLAFRLYDPEHLLGDVEDLGITCALIPTATPGVINGRRHYPSGAVFHNGPTQGADVFMPIEWIIGGPTMAGQGWRMLMECLSVGRAITLPSSSSAGVKVACMAGGAYARVRTQFGMPIGKFEGIEEVLAKVAGYAYIITAAHDLTLTLVDDGEEPAVASAIVKYHTTEMAREAIIGVMDIHGGKGICQGPNNYLADAYHALPIAITVEGANILTRNMIIFGQGAMRCHPYVFQEMRAGQEKDLQSFDKALFGHLGFIISNFARSFLLGISNGMLSRAGVGKMKPTRFYYKQFTRFSSVLALLADFAMMILGGELKRRERLSARFGDILSYLYLGTAVLKRFEDQGRQVEDLPLVHWSCQTMLYRIEQALDGILKNFPTRILRVLLRWIVLPLGHRHLQPNDYHDHKLASILLSPSASRSRLGAGIDLVADECNAVGRLEAALPIIIAAEPLEKKLQVAFKRGDIKGKDFAERLEAAKETGILTPEEVEQLREANSLRADIIAVDDFPFELLHKLSVAVSGQSNHEVKKVVGE